MIHVQGQAAANWRRHADFTASRNGEPIPLSGPLTLSSPRHPTCPHLPAPACSPRPGSPGPVLPCAPRLSHFPEEPHTLVMVVWGRQMAAAGRIKQEHLQVEYRTLFVSVHWPHLAPENLSPRSGRFSLPILFSEFQVPSSLLSWAVPFGEMEEKFLIF